jgi:hypothetical protein
MEDKYLGVADKSGEADKAQGRDLNTVSKVVSMAGVGVKLVYTQGFSDILGKVSQFVTRHPTLADPPHVQ